MKKIFLGMILAVAGLAANAQLENVFVEKIPVSQAAADADENLTTNHVTYRVFVDMADGYEFQLFNGLANQPLKFETTTQFYNDENDGDLVPTGIRPLPTLDEPLYYDSWVTISAYGERAAATSIVPFSEDTDGTVDGFFGDYPALEFAFAPGTDSRMEPMLGYENNPGNYVDENASVYVGGGVTGPTATNTVCIGQFTTNGDISITLGGIQIREIGTTNALLYVYENPTGTNIQSDLLFYTSKEIVLVPPTAEISAPVAGSSVNKGDDVTITATGDDADGDVVLLSLYVNGVLESEVENPANGTAVDFTWTCPGGTAATFTVIAKDNDGQTTESDPVTVGINDPDPTVVTLISPSADTTINLNPITLIVSAVDGDEGIAQVEFLIDGTVIATDVDGTDGYTAEFEPPTEGTFSFNARATSGAGAEVVSLNPAMIIVGNAVPTATITAPVAPFTLIIENDTLIEVSADDIDGTVAQVEFYVNGASSPAIVDNDPSDGLSFNFMALPSHIGSVTISAIAVDNAGAESAPAEISFSVTAGDDSPKYMIKSVEAFCSSSDVFCLPIVTAAPVDGVIGYDFELVYDASKVSPTGLVDISADLLGAREYATYKINIKENVAYISLFLNSNAPAGTVFSGEGQLICVEFTRNFNFGDEESAEFTMPVVAESYPAYVLETSAFAGTYTSTTETMFNGSLSFWSDNSPISYVEGINAITEIYGDIDPSIISTPDEDGKFTHNIKYGEKITITRDVENSFDVQPIISGEDAYYTALVTVQEEGFTPNVYQIIAMDVNRDGRVSAGDISQMQQRTIGAIGEFVQADGMAKDWVFIKTGDILSDRSYRVSADYPASDGIGFSRLNVPVVTDEIVLPIEGTDCKIISDENFKGILIGDVTGNYAAQPSSPQLKSDTEESPLVIKVGKELVDDVASINVFVDSENNITSYDFSIDLNNIDAEFVGAIDLASMNEACNVTNDNILKCSAYNFGKYKKGDLITLNFKANSPLKSDDIAVITSNINEKNVTMTIKESQEVTAIEEVAAISVYPNPAFEVLNVKAPVGSSIKLMNKLTQTVATQIAVSNITSVDVSSLASGSYHVQVVNGSQVSDFELIIE